MRTAQLHLESSLNQSNSSRQAPSRILMTADCVGGVWNYSLDLAEALAEFGVQVALATMGPRPSQKQREQAARISTLKLFESDYKLEWMDSPWADVDAAGIWLLDLARNLLPEVVHLNSYTHAGLPWNAPVVVVAHSCVKSWWKAVKSGPVPPVFAEYTRRVSDGLCHADLLIAPTNAMLNAIDQNYEHSVPAKVIPNGCFRTQYSPAAKMDFILTAGRLWDEAKGLPLLERIAPKLRWPIYAAGENRHPSGSQARLRNIHLLGHLDNEKLAGYLGAASIYAAPALYEPFGLTVLEAALSGCALVLSAISSFRENWNDAALLIPADDHDEWCTALDRLSSDRDLRLALARKARDRAVELQPQEIGSRYFNIYCEVLAKHGSPNRENFGR
ncbi:MAG: glycosyltransferase family 4 protein [Verrucomicrobia bacterium]|nr:glycosyltransferase family 4 protein [Verrucomicrobiota bacterium]